MLSQLDVSIHYQISNYLAGLFCHFIMDSLRILTDPSVLASASILCSGLLVTYIFYMHFMHPLSNFPGPLLPSLTSAWKAYYVYKLTLHERLVELHEQYGPVVRVGPNHLHFWDEEAIAPIYKGGRKMGKTEFYDAFTAFKPNLFGGRDEDVCTETTPPCLVPELNPDRFIPSVEDSYPTDFRNPRFRISSTSSMVR